GGGGAGSVTAIALREATSTPSPPIDFDLPDELVAHEPPEARGLARDAVRLMVSRAATNTFAHTRFSHLPDFLRRGDVLVINTSRTINAAFAATREARDCTLSDVMLHLSTRLLGRGEVWVVAVRRPFETGSSTIRVARAVE